MFRAACLFVALLLGATQLPTQSPQTPPPQQPPPAQQPVAPLPAEAQPLAPTVHAALPKDLEDYWFAPTRAERGRAKSVALTDAAAAFAAGNFQAALTHARAAVAAAGPLAVYAQYYIGVSNLRLANAAGAEKAFDEVIAAKPQGELSVSAVIGKAESLDLRGDHAGAADLYATLTNNKGAQPEDVLARLARTAQLTGDRKRSADAWLRVYYEFPLSDAAASAADAIASLQDIIVTRDDRLDLGRAQVLFGAKRYPEARSAFEDLQKRVAGGDKELVDLRLAECNYFLKHYAASRDGVRPYLENASRVAEAKFFYLSSLRGLGDADEALALTKALLAEFPNSSWSEEALSNLGTHYIVTNQDDLAAETFRDLYERFPAGPHAERAAWKYGWWAFTTGKYAETVRVFEKAAASFPRSDYRPPYLYWAGRAHEKLGQKDIAEARMRLVTTDYLNSYYGRLAAKRLPAAEAATPRPSPTLVPASLQTPQAPPIAAPPPNAPLVRQLLAAGLYDDGLNELKFAQRAWGTSPAIEATMAWVYHEKGELRRAITVMRRAYPQFLAKGGEELPAEILQVIFPLTYWDAIKKNAALNDLDPYVVAALIGQESTFDPTAHSPANAWGLMQIVPSTGRRLARSVGMRRFGTSMLTNPETNVRLGTVYFSQLIKQFGGAYYALASYDAGENRVIRWKAERPGMDEDEFIDDIPFPETQNYVKRILGTAEDYRQLYGEGEGTPGTPVKKPAAKKPAAKKPAAKKKAPAKKPTTTKKKKRGGGSRGI